MKTIISSIITGYTLLILMKKMSNADDSDKCELSNLNETWAADCKKLNLKKIPDNLNEFIQILNLTHSTIFTFNNESFTPYNLLEVIDMFNVTIQNWERDNWNIFRPLNKLRIVNLSHSDLRLFSYTLAHQFWPVNLRSLNISYSNLNFSSMVLPTPLLEVLDLSHNNISITPRIYLGPKVLYLNDNPSLLAAAEFFTTQCRLEYVELNLPFNIYQDRKLEVDPFCTCRLLKSWFNFTETRHNLGECNFSTGVRCPNWFPQDWIDTRNKCELNVQYWKKIFAVNKYPTWLWGLLLYLLGVILVASFIYTHRIRARYRMMKAGVKNDEENVSGRGFADSEQVSLPKDKKYKQPKQHPLPTTKIPPKLRKWKISGK